MNIGELFLSQDICCVQITDNKNLLIIYEHCDNLLNNVWFQKISILPPQKGLEIQGRRGGSGRAKNLKQCMKLNRNFQRGGWGGHHRANPFRGGYGYFLEPHNM